MKFLAALLAICMLASPVMAMDFPAKLGPGKYTLEVPKENAPWTVLDSTSWDKTLTNIMELKLTIDYQNKKALLDSNYKSELFNVERKRLIEINNINLTLEKDINKSLKGQLEDARNNGELLGVSKFTWGVLVGVLITSLARK